jgi:hypothetical protein
LQQIVIAPYFHSETLKMVFSMPQEWFFSTNLLPFSVPMSKDMAASWETCQNPAFYDLHGNFNFGFGFANPCRDDGGVTMIGHAQIGGVDIRFIKAGFADP